MSLVSFHQFDQYDGLKALDTEAYSNRFAPHYHNSLQVTWNRCGTFVNHINGQSQHAGPNTLAISHPKEVHQTVCEVPGGHAFFTLYLPPPLLGKPTNADQWRFSHVIEDPELVRLMAAIQAAVQQDQVPNEWLLQRLLRRLKQHQTRGQCQPSDGALYEFAQQRYLAPFDLSTWSQELGMSPYQLIRAFKHSTGMTPNQWVIHHRIKHSLGHLIAGASITDSALAAGFYDAAHYHRHFKKIMGVTPATFQQS